MSKKQAYEEKLQSQLDEFNAKMDLLQAKAAKAEASTKLSYYDSLEELKLKRTLAKEKLEELKNSSGDAWEDLKGGVDAAWTDFSAAVKAAASHFQ